MQAALLAWWRLFRLDAESLTQVPEADDDLLEFRFGPDAAIRKFVAVKE